jgi:pimeloyl-ACP methyl ester carboxylesterase
VLRDGVDHDLHLTGGAAPVEQADSVGSEYTSFVSGGVRLRAVVTSPKDSEGKRLPGLLIVSALRSPQLIGSSFHSLTRTLAHRAARAGFRVLRFELRGFGDSEGEDYHTTDFETEVADNAAALEYLAARPDVIGSRVIVYGHSTGGMEAAVLAARGKAAGLIVSCTIGRTFLERTADTIRLQATLGGNQPEQVDASVNRYLSFSAAILHGAPTEQLRNDSTFAGFFNERGRIMDDRTIDFWRQQLGLSLGGTYSRVRCPTLILYGASDFLTSLACHERIRDVMTASGNPDVTLAVIPACDHAYSWAQDQGEAFRNQQAGGFKENPAAIGRIVDWLRGQAAGS